MTSRLAWRRGADYLAEIERLKGEWETLLAERRDSDEVPFTSQRPLGELRKVMARDGIIVVGSGNTQGAVKQTFPVYHPRTHLTSGSFSSMGWAVPAAIGAKLAMPDKQVVWRARRRGLSHVAPGDGRLRHAQHPRGVPGPETNCGYMSIRGGQRKITGRHVGQRVQPAQRRTLLAGLRPGGEWLRARGLASGARRGPGTRSCVKPWPRRGRSWWKSLPPGMRPDPTCPGWWDFPVPAYVDDGRQAEYTEGRNQEQHL